MIKRLLSLLLLLLVTSSCMSNESRVRLGGEWFSVELATTPKEQSMGLMFRDQMDEDHGMLFVFPTETIRSFWMKNTRISLDIFYFDAELRLVSVSENTPPCRIERCPSYPSEGPARYVLELNAGKAEQLGVAPGDSLELDLD